MSRDIRFRIWLGSIGKMSHEIDFYTLIEPTTDYRLTDKSIVMQFTGLQDKNGNDIYEGDIVKWRAKFGHETYDLVIEFRHSSFMIGADYLDQVHDNLIEVIGNIHQHKELLEKAEA